MKINTRLIRSDCILIIKKDFDAFLLNQGILNSAETNASELRRLMFDFFSTPVFLYQYKILALCAAEAVGYGDQDFLVQKMPTPRIFRHGAHGTSYHCDYWYGHGERSYTTWVALSEVDSENTFLMCHDSHNSYMYDKLIARKNFINIETEDERHFYPVAPLPDQGVLFSSKAIHGSPVNRSLNQRISFDFRIGCIDDKTATKNINSYFRVVQNEFISQNIFDGVNFIRYVCGGENRDTFSQHVVIDGFAKALNLNIVGQEAEIERLGYPMLTEILESKSLDKNFNAIIIASESILSKELQLLAKSSSIKIYAALEYRFL